MPTLSIVIPAFNERRRLPRALELIRKHMTAGDLDWEVIVVDDGSTDGTADLVRQYASEWPALRLVQLPRNRGKGAAVKAGVNASLAPIVGFTDADLAAPIEQLDLLLADLADSEVAIVSRALPGARLGKRQSFGREAMGRAYSRLTEALVLRGVRDAQCGLKLYRGSAARSIFARVVEDGIIFDTEALLVATQHGYRISQRPATWDHDPDSRIRSSVPMAVDVAMAILRMKLRHRVMWPPRASGPLRAAGDQVEPVMRAAATVAPPQRDEVTAHPA
jgi:glycosyltransferase involved in cell wall biosynthesis